MAVVEVVEQKNQGAGRKGVEEVVAAKAGADYIESTDQIDNTLFQMEHELAVRACFGEWKAVEEEGMNYLEVGVVAEIGTAAAETVIGEEVDELAEVFDFVAEEDYYNLDVDNLQSDASGNNSAAAEIEIEIEIEIEVEVESKNPIPESTDFLALVAAVGAQQEVDLREVAEGQRLTEQEEETVCRMPCIHQVQFSDYSCLQTLKSPKN